MKYPRIITEISNHQWAITEEALENILRIVETANSETAREIFHLATEEYKAEVFESLDGGDEYNDYTRVIGSVGVLSIDGPIVPRSSSLRKVSGMNSISSLTREFKRLESDDSITDIVLLFDSPGGAVTGTSEFSELVAASKKRTTSYIYGMANSAAYWIASSADNVISSNTGQVGSIGVIATVSRSKDDDKIEIVSSRAKNKRPDTETKEGKEQYLKMVNDLEKVFIDTVAKNRKTTVETVEKDFGQGGILIAEEALSAGMIDGISTLDGVLKKLESKEKTGFTFNMGDNREAVNNNAVDETANTRSEKMNIAEMRKSDPDFAAEFDRLLEAAAINGKKEGEKMVLDRIKLSANVLNADYPQRIKEFAMEVIMGKKDPVALEGAVVTYDAMKSEQSTLDAIGDTDSIGDTPPDHSPGLSGDGVVRTEEDFHACVTSLSDRR